MVIELRGFPLFAQGSVRAAKWSLTRPTTTIPSKCREERSKLGRRFGTGVQIRHIQLSRFCKESI